MNDNDNGVVGRNVGATCCGNKYKQSPSSGIPKVNNIRSRSRRLVLSIVLGILTIFANVAAIASVMKDVVIHINHVPLINQFFVFDSKNGSKIL